MDDIENKPVNVIIKTLKERCLALQKRVATLEQQNIELHQQNSVINKKDNKVDDDTKLNNKMIELTQENTQLKERILMISFENKNLWTRLKHMTLDFNKHTNCSVENKIAAPQLIRSQTFTQNSPNPKLIAKLEDKEKDEEDDSKISLEEISLKILNSFIAEKSELVEQYQQMVELQKGSDFNVSKVGFTYLGDGINYDSISDIKKYTEKMMELKNIVLRQQADLKNYISKIDAKKQEEKMSEICIMKNSSELSKEVTEIDSPETEVLDSSTRWATPANSTSYHDNIDDSSCSQNTSRLMNNVQTTSKTHSKNKDEEEILNATGKRTSNFTCPMCGEQFKTAITFEKFQEHVEGHFIDVDLNSFDEDNLVLPVQ